MKDKKTDDRIEDLTAQAAALQVRLDTAESELAEAKSRADAAEGSAAGLREQIKTLEAERADDEDGPARLKEQIKALANKVTRLEKERNDALSPTRIREFVKERVALEAAAGAVLNGRAGFEDMTDRALRVKAIEHMAGGARVDDTRSDEYVKAQFETLVEGFAKTAERINDVRQAIREGAEKAASDRKDNADGRSARQRFLDEQNNAWKTAQKEAR